MNSSQQALPRHKSISVLVPCLNEEDTIVTTVERLVHALNVSVEDYEIIIVNDGSTDNTGTVADDLARANPAIKVIHNEQNKGLGASYAIGVDAATKKYLVYIPGDDTWPYRSFLELIGSLGIADIITSYSSNPGARSFGRHVVSKLYTRSLNLLFDKNMQYFNGLTIYPMEFLRLHPVTTLGFGFQAETLLKALSLGYSFIELPLPIDERTAAGSKAITLSNILSVMTSVLWLFWTLRVTRSWQKTHEFPPPHVSLGRASGTVDELGLRSIVTRETEGDGVPLRRRIVLTGGSSGIGAALAKALALDGHKVVVCSSDPRKLSALAEPLSIDNMACDVSQEDQVVAFRAFVEERLGGIDVLINCAGTFGEIGPLSDSDSDNWLRTIHVNLFGTYLCSKQFLPLLRKGDKSCIIHFSGGGAFSPFPNYSAYACSKAAIVRLTETMAVELAAEGIAVNAVAPGLVATPVHEATIRAGPGRAGPLQFRRTQSILKGVGQASMDVVVRCVRHLISPEYHSLTGKTISANFDPWDSEVFIDKLDKISSSDVFTLRRINFVNLPHGSLKESMLKVRSSHDTQI